MEKRSKEGVRETAEKGLDLLHSFAKILKETFYGNLKKLNFFTYLKTYVK